MSQSSEFDLLLPFFTPRTVFLHVGAGDGELALLAATYVERVYAIGVTQKFLRRPKLPVNLRFAWPRYGEVDVAFSAQAQPQLAERIRETLGPDGKYFVLGGERRDGWLSKLFPRTRLVASIRQ
jgi:hypothetical protein